jgi:hypothetical protein
MKGSRLDRGLLAVSIGLLVLLPVTAAVGLVDRAGEDGPSVRAAGPGGVKVTTHAHGSEYAIQYKDLPTATRGQLDIVEDIINRYPTAADAEKAGWHKATTNLKGIASHYLRGGVGGFISIDGTFDVRDPEILLYNGEGPDAPIAGVSYLADGPDPAGFAGKWDVWHRHQAVCFARGLVIGEIDGHEGSRIDMTREACTAEGGLSFPLANLTMLHVWMKPGFESSSGVFSHDHPKLYGDAG